MQMHRDHIFKKIKNKKERGLSYLYCHRRMVGTTEYLIL